MKEMLMKMPETQKEFGIINKHSEIIGYIDAVIKKRSLFKIGEL